MNKTYAAAGSAEWLEELKIQAPWIAPRATLTERIEANVNQLLKYPQVINAHRDQVYIWEDIQAYTKAAGITLATPALR